MNSERTPLEHLNLNEPLPENTQRLLENSEHNNLLIRDICEASEIELWQENADSSLFSVAIATGSLVTADSILFDNRGNIRSGINPMYCGARCIDLSTLESSPVVNAYWALATLRSNNKKTPAASSSNLTQIEMTEESAFIHIASPFISIAQEILTLETQANDEQDDKAITAYEKLHGKYMQLSSIETYDENAFSWCIAQANKCAEKISSLKAPARSSWDSLFSKADLSQEKASPPPITSRSLTKISHTEISSINTAYIGDMFKQQQYDRTASESQTPLEWKIRYDGAGKAEQTKSVSLPKFTETGLHSNAPKATLYGPSETGMRRRHPNSNNGTRPTTPPAKTNEDRTDEALKPKFGGGTPPRFSNK
jgi:hypothetical protein